MQNVIHTPFRESDFLENLEEINVKLPRGRDCFRLIQIVLSQSLAVNFRSRPGLICPENICSSVGCVRKES